MARKDCAIAFRPDSALWRLLSEDPDRYIYPAVAHGITWNTRRPDAPERLDVPFGLPGDIAAGNGDEASRGGWNSLAPDDYALPTETWREVFARRQRYKEVRARLASGEVHRIDDLITLNLDIRQFAQDVILDCEGPELLRAFWKAIRSISVLDPACGSGAFLFAALNVLDPLYDACLERMEAFLDALDSSGKGHRPEKYRDFRHCLDEVARHPNRRYFILKSIIIGNLYGVDIMEEAVEICKLRLFLKLAAQASTVDKLEPLPDLDFNVRVGNTLVGFARLRDLEGTLTYKMDFDSVLPRIRENAELADEAFTRFRAMQTEHDMRARDFHRAKEDLRQRQGILADELDAYLAREYSVEPGIETDFAAWRQSHQPFHWFAEFYGVLNSGGFDVIIGNPPYVPAKSIAYRMRFQDDVTFPDIYGYMLLRSQQLHCLQGRRGFIIPLSFTFSHYFGKLREELTRDGTHWISSYDIIPAALFSGVSQRCTVWLCSSTGDRLYSSPLLRWRSAFRNSLLSNIAYAKSPNGLGVASFGIPRLSNPHGTKMLRLHIDASSSASPPAITQTHDSSQLGFSQTARNFISTYLEPPPVLSVRDGSLIESNQGGWLPLKTTDKSKAALAVASGDACFWYWLMRGDGFHMTKWLLQDFLAPLDTLPASFLVQLEALGELLHERRYTALVFKKNAGKYVGNYNYRNLSFLTRRADSVWFAGLGASWRDIQGIRAYVALVRAVNTQIGEKNIPDEVKRRFVSKRRRECVGDRRLCDIDFWLAKKLSIAPVRIRLCMNASENGTEQC